MGVFFIAAPFVVRLNRDFRPAGLIEFPTCGWIAALVLAGTLVNPLLFLPLAWGNQVTRARWYQAITIASFAALSVGLSATAAHSVL